MLVVMVTTPKLQVAPVRERGLKFSLVGGFSDSQGRSRKGAWIEIAPKSSSTNNSNCRSRKGAWIEIWLTDICTSTCAVAPVRERGLK